MNSTIKLNSIFNKLSQKKKSKLLGRGIGCGKGKTSGRGHKGQKARSGVSINGFEGGQQSIYTRLPKRGFNLIRRNIYPIINVADIQHLIETKKIVKGSVIDKEMLCKLGCIKSVKDKVKLLNKGKLNEKCVFRIDFASEAARKSVASVGGSVEILS
ncbi:50S ribosomal protein L15 [Wolbachia endosymbiont of Ctenocephalides felis wCfeJ]|uniref:50S ribosomal protein L15 n=1 Tax=Wolbachia endosymbiont of Ctenocephalides felis wCfeJ TaxID=2732594 RepID=UPI0014468400|nr:50S ribosomal protein L15 [Wolbachia endosymbiont of Ctenocephalides felis wCfeJ]WCR58253.1 MAG: 50S ribosomal protein L15 [Wolbachia endosymbiont of Ctenocephalides felis wCfeJ]